MDISTDTACKLRRATAGDVIDGLTVVDVSAPRVVGIGLDCPLDTSLIITRDSVEHWWVIVRSVATHMNEERVTVREVVRVQPTQAIAWVPV